jgi:hypothetical protein
VKPELLDMDDAELDGLKARIQEAKEHNLALSQEDMALVFTIIETLAYLQDKLTDKDITLHKMRKLLGIVQSTETLKTLTGNDGATESKRNRTTSSATKPKAPKVVPTVVHHALDELKKGDVCPACETGKLYKFEPAQLLRVAGSSPLTVEQHVSERLRCNTCGELFTAKLAEDVLADGEAGQKYGYSARSVIAINKYYGGTPFYRQESLQNLLGVPVTASTAFDQTELVANDLFPLFNCMKTLAANAWHYHIDDTTHRIIDQKPVKKKKRGSQQEQMRTGVYSSGLIAELDSGHKLILYQTNIGHAGEWIDEILEKRAPDQPAPLVMSDALPHNRPSVTAFIQSLCNSHGRRQYVDVHEHFAEEVEWVLKQYSCIWQHDATVKAQNLSPEARLAYHREHSLPVMENIRDWGKTQLQTDTVEENSGLGKAIRYFDKHYNGLTRFCTHIGARIDNNIMERYIKLIVRNRKNANFYKTPSGAAIGDVLTSVIATAAEARVNIFDYLNCLQRYRDQLKANPEKWLPWEYEDTLGRQA